MLKSEQNISEVEDQIKKAAKKVFLKKGLAGSRLQEIADEANIGRTALHYYYRSKEKLFEVVFSEAFGEMHRRMSGLMTPDLPVWEKIKVFVDGYYKRVACEPDLDFFIINEYNKNPEEIQKVLVTNSMDRNTVTFLDQISDAVKQGELKGDPHHIFITMLSLCIYPIIAKSMLQTVMHHTDEEYELFIEQWKSHVVRVLEMSFKK